MPEAANQTAEELPLEGPGDRLRRAREVLGKSIEEIAEETRIPRRHLETIETGDFVSLPSRTYAIGFSRTYAGSVGLDENEIVDQVRAGLGVTSDGRTGAVSTFEPGDPARIPGKRLAWFSAFAALVLVAGLLAFFGDRVFPGAGPGSILPVDAPAPATSGFPANPASSPPPPATGGAVVFTALDEGVWVRFTAAGGTRLLEKQLAKGETFTVPADVEDPRINTGRPDLLAITIGGRSVAKLAEEPVTLGDEPVSAAALMARTNRAPGVGE